MPFCFKQTKNKFKTNTYCYMMRKLLYSFLFSISSKSFLKRLSAPSLGLLCVGMFFVFSFADAATYYSRRTGDWTANSTWSTTSGGSQVGTGIYPGTGDIVIIEKGFTVHINANVSCATLQVGSPGNGGNNYGEIDFSGAYTLAVSGNSMFGGNGAAARTGTITFSNGSVFNTGSLNVGNTSGGTKAAGIIDMSAGGTMNISGSIIVTAVTGNSWTSGSGTVIMSASNTLPSTLFTSFNNLTISSGTTTFSTGLTINGTLSIASVANLGTGLTHTANKLTLGGLDTVAGSWGSTSSAATNQNNTYFSAVSGIVNVSASNCSLASFTMTGGGGYCGVTGTSLGLSGSESGVNYQLYRGTTAVGSPVPGTGNALSFGTANTIGEYTVVASKSFCKLTFGPVSIYNYSTPPTPTATVGKTTCPASADGSITITNALTPASLAFTSANNQYVNLGTSLLSNRAAFTIEGWVKFDRATAIAANRMSLFGQNDAVEIGFINGNLICYTLNGGQVDMSLSANYPNDNGWHHIAVTADGTTNGIKIYVDGSKKVEGGSAVTNYGLSSDPTRFGWGTVDASGGGYTGEVFKLGFWNRALSQAEVTSMASGFVVYNASQTGLLAGFSFNEGTGTTVASVGSAGLPASSLVNSPVWTDPYSYSWTSNPAGFTATTKNITGLTARTYNLTTSLKGCTNTGTWNVTSNNSNNTITLSSATGTDTQIACLNTPITNIRYATTGATGATFSGLPSGVTGSWTANVVTISGAPTVNSASPYNYTVTLTGGCGTITASGTITVNPNNTIALSSAAGTNAQTKCINTPITNITYNTTGATGATFTGLPSGVTGSWAANVVTISGTPTVSVGSPYNYTVTLTGGCGGGSVSGTIAVTPDNTITLSSATGTNAQTKCINTPITNITYNTTGATGATFLGLPSGVTGGWAANVVTISGTPTVSAGSPYNYTVTLTGGCGNVSTSGTITVTPDNTITLSSATGTNAQTKCINTPITNITYNTTGATGATFLGLPSGVTGGWAANVVTISGTPTVSAGSPYNYTVTLTGGCGNVSTSGTITVTPDNTITLSSATGTNAQTKCINTPITNITYNTTGATGATFLGLPSGVTGGWAANVVTISGTPTVSAGSPYNYTVTLTGGCGNVSTSGTITVNPNNTIALSSAVGTDSQTVCANTAITSITYATTGATGATFSGLPSGVTGGWSGNVVTIIGTPTTEVGSPFNYTITLTNGCGNISATGTITVNPQPTTPSVSHTNVSCGTLGSITLNNLPSGNWRVNQSGQRSNQYYRVNIETTLVIGQLQAGTYDFTVTDMNTGCVSNVASVVILDTSSSTEWDGNGWTNGTPNQNSSVTISSVTPNQPFENMVGADLTVCSLIVNVPNGPSDPDVIIPPTMTLTVTNDITSNGKLSFESGSSLLQSESAVNTGTISYKRKVSMRRFDVVYWATPVTDAGLTMRKFSPNTLFDKYHYWNATTSQWVLSNYGIEVMKKGQGYSIRGPQNFDLVTPSTFEGIFVGTPNNGDVSVPVVQNKLNLLGNPYPSPINANKLLLENKDEIGALYFWTHNQPPQVIPGTNTFKYNSSDFVVYNGVGSTRVSGDPVTGPDEFKGYIGAGQAFFSTTPGTVIKFNNGLREKSTQNTQFYKTANEVEKNRLWLNIANTQGAFKQLLIGYVEGATNGIDPIFDATTMGSNSYLDFYSINESKKLTIQGRALPFNNAEVIPLGYKSGVDDKGDRSFTISIDHADGLFTTQPVYLEDKETGKIVDLRKENYTFFSVAGTNTTRFTLRYTNKTLGTDDFENLENTVLVSVKDKTLKIVSSKETLKEVRIYNVGAQLLYSKDKINASELQIANLNSSDQVILVKITLENGHTITKKVIFSNL